MQKKFQRPLTEGPIGQRIFLFSVPIILSNLLQVIFNMSDIAVVGHFAGSSALGAVGSTQQLVALFTAFLIGMASGINVLVARHFGAGHEKLLRQTVHTAFGLSLLLGIVLYLIGILVAKPILVLFGTRQELLGGALLYVRLFFIGMPAMAVYNFGSAVYDAIGNTKKPLQFLALSGILNIGLNLFFVLVCHWDVAGVAVASALSQLLAAILIIRSLMHEELESCRLSKEHFRIDRDIARSLLRLGLSSGFQTAIFPIANLFIQSGVNSFDSTMVAGNAAAANADSIVYDTMNAFYIACASFMSQNYGARQKARVLRSYLSSLAWSFGAGLVLGLSLAFAGPRFLGIFTTDPEVISAGMTRLRIMGFSYAFSAFMDCTIAASRALGYTLVPTIIVIMGSCVFRILWIMTIFAHFHTIFSLYSLYIFSWSLTSLFEILYFVRIWKRIYGTGDLAMQTNAHS